MIKIIVNIAVALLLLFMLAACTQNNGNIGLRFGMWRMKSIDINGIPDPQFDKPLFWSFQSGVIEMKIFNDKGDCLARSFGECEETEGKLILDFRNVDNENPDPGAPVYSPLAETHLPANSLVTLNIVEMSKKNMILTYVAPTGVTYTYKLSLWG